ncbi:hypothetical protein HWV62_30571 [Athelia sp. TMB]|nr:hypothetical protein HWV62_30571 [Athelia sp. TMB]
MQAAGSAVPSVTRDLLEDAARDGRAQDDFETQVKWAAGALYGAGGETTYTTVLVFVALMALHPAQQALVHDELDRVVGADRLPALADRGRLPYLEAAIKEAMRWHPALRAGKFIPAGTLVLPNVWALSRDAHGAPSDAFAPERFLDASGATDPSSYAFGFGRRICPGKYLAENSVFIMIATLLACFDFAPPADRPLELRFATGLVRYFAIAISSKVSVGLMWLWGQLPAAVRVQDHAALGGAREAARARGGAVRGVTPSNPAWASVGFCDIMP